MAARHGRNSQTQNWRNTAPLVERHQGQAFVSIRNLVVLETQAEHFFKVLENGSISTNIYLRRIHNFALDMNWLPWPVLSKKRWPMTCKTVSRGG